MIDAENSTLASNLLVMIGAFFFLGGRHITAGSTGSTPRDCEGGPSIRMLIKRICIALRGLDRPSIVLRVISVRAAAAVLSWNARKFWMLWKIDLPDFCQKVVTGSNEVITFFDSRQNRGEVIVHQDHIGRLFRHVRSTLAH